MGLLAYGTLATAEEMIDPSAKITYLPVNLLTMQLNHHTSLLVTTWRISSAFMNSFIHAWMMEAGVWDVQVFVKCLLVSACFQNLHAAPSRARLINHHIQKLHFKPAVAVCDSNVRQLAVQRIDDEAEKLLLTALNSTKQSSM